MFQEHAKGKETSVGTTTGTKMMTRTRILRESGPTLSARASHVSAVPWDSSTSVDSLFLVYSLEVSSSTVKAVVTKIHPSKFFISSSSKFFSLCLAERSSIYKAKDQENSHTYTRSRMHNSLKTRSLKTVSSFSGIRFQCVFSTQEHDLSLHD